MKTHQQYNIPTDAFGLCPQCKQQPIMFAIGKNDFCRCDRCNVYWTYGRGNLAPCYDEAQNETNRRKLLSYTEVEPMRWGTDDSHFYLDREDILRQATNPTDSGKNLPF